MFAYTSSNITTIFDVWHSGNEYHTGSAVDVETFNSQNYNFDLNISKVTNLRAVYNKNELDLDYILVKKIGPQLFIQ